MSGEPRCPRCGAATARVSALYMAALEALSHPAAELPEELRALLGGEARLRGWLRIRALRRLVRLTAPPAGERRRTRLVHPDALVAAFTLIVAVALVRAGREQPQAARAAAAAVAVAAILYFALRPRVLARHAVHRAREHDAAAAVERRVALWMTLRCCTAERAVDGFEGEPGVPLEELPRRLAAGA